MLCDLISDSDYLILITVNRSINQNRSTRNHVIVCSCEHRHSGMIYYTQYRCRLVNQFHDICGIRKPQNANNVLDVLYFSENHEINTCVTDTATLPQFKYKHTHLMCFILV